MKEVIEQIVRIDSEAFETERKNRHLLENERARLENEMREYREKRLKDAEKQAVQIYDRIVGEAMENHRKQEQKMRDMADRINENYKKVESAVLKKVMEKLFM